MGVFDLFPVGAVCFCTAQTVIKLLRMGFKDSSYFLIL